MSVSPPDYPYGDFRDYLAALEHRGLLVHVARRIDKDSELVPLVRLQFRGLPAERRRAFLFTDVTDSRGRSFDASVAIGTFASSRAVYAAALGVDPEDDAVGDDAVGQVWQRALARPVEPARRPTGPCKETIVTGPAAFARTGGVDAFPHPISTPGFDPAPFLTSPYWVTRDPEDGTYNVGTYRGMIKAPDRVGLQMDTPSQHIAVHLAKARRLRRRLPAAVVLGTVPAVGLASVQKVPYGVSEYAVAGGLMGAPLEVVRCETVDIDVPAHAELVFEGEIDPDRVEPEGPFGEASGYMGPGTWSPVLQVTCITHRANPVVQAFISEFPPSESTLMRKIGFENVYRRFLRTSCNIGSVRDVTFYEPATCNMMFVIRLADARPGQAWEALHAAAGYEPSMGKIIIAVDEDIDPANLESLVWALAFRTQPARDMQIIGDRLARLDPSAPEPVPGGDGNAARASALLIDATRSKPYPPISLPTPEHMERALTIWSELGLPALNLVQPWHGYELGAWTADNREHAALAALGRYLETGARLAGQSRPAGPHG